MNTLDLFWIDRYVEIFVFVILMFIAFQKKRPLFLLVILFLNTLPDLWMIPSSTRVHWINPPETAPSASMNWLSQLHDHPPQSAVMTALHPLIQKLLPENPPFVQSRANTAFNQTAFYLRAFLLLLVLSLFLIDHVHGVAGLGAFLFPTFYLLQRIFQGLELIVPFQLERQFILFREAPVDYLIAIPSNPTGLWMLVIALVTIAVGTLIAYYFTRRQSRAYNILVPNPENYQVILQGVRYDYHYTGEGVFIEMILFPFAEASSNQANRKELRFSSGTVLHFVKREE